MQGVTETSVNAIKTKEDLIAEEKNNIISALKACNGKIFGDDGAAQMLNLKPTTLTSKLKRWKINRHQFIQM